MAKCPTCGAPVNWAPGGDPKYEPPFVTITRRLCAECNGDGVVRRSYGYIPCPACNGKGS